MLFKFKRKLWGINLMMMAWDYSHVFAILCFTWWNLRVSFSSPVCFLFIMYIFRTTHIYVWNPNPQNIYIHMYILLQWYQGCMVVKRMLVLDCYRYMESTKIHREQVIQTIQTKQEICIHSYEMLYKFWDRAEFI